MGALFRLREGLENRVKLKFIGSYQNYLCWMTLLLQKYYNRMDNSL